MLNSKEIIVDKTNTEMIHTGARNRIYARAASLLLATMVAFGAAGCGKTAKEQGKIETENSLEASTGNVQEAQEEKEAPGSNTKKADSADTAADKNQKVPSGRSAASGNGSQDTGKNKPSGQAGNEGQAAGKNKSSGSSGNKSSSRSASSDNRKTVNDNRRTVNDNSRTIVEKNYYTDNYYVENNHAENSNAEVQVQQQNITQVQQVAENTEVTNYDVDVTDIDEDYNIDVTDTEEEYYIDVNTDSDENMTAGENEDDTEETEEYIAKEEETEPIEAEDPYAGIIDISTEDMLSLLTDGYWIGGMHQAQVLEFTTDGRIYEVGVGVNQNGEWTFLKQDKIEYGTYDVDHDVLTIYLDGGKRVTLKYVDSASGYEALETEDAGSRWSQTAEEMSVFDNRFFYETAYVYNGSGDDVRCLGHLGQVHFEDGENTEACDGEGLGDEETYEYEDEAAYYDNADNGYTEYSDNYYEDLSDEDASYEEVSYGDASEGTEYLEEYEEGSEW